METPRSSSVAVRLLLNAALVALALLLTLTWARLPGRAALIWLPTGVEVGLLLRLPRSQWRDSLVVYFLLTLVGIAWSGTLRWTVGIGWPIVNTAGVWLTASLLARDADWVQGRTERIGGWIRFTWIGGLLMPAAWGLAGAAVLATSPTFAGTVTAYLDAAIGRYVNNALSIFVLVPMFVRFEQWRRLGEIATPRVAAGWLGLFGAGVALACSVASVLPLFLLPLAVVFLLFRLEFIGTIACMLILLLGVLGSTLAHHGPFIALAAGDFLKALWMAQGYLMTTFATIVLVTGLLAERQATVQRTAELAAESARMKSAFVARISHEIRTPLTAILGFAELLQHDTTLGAENLESVRIINRSGGHLLNLVNEVLDMAKIDAGQVELAPRNIDLRAFFDTLAAMMNERARRKGLAFAIDLEPGLPPCVRVDAQKLRQVLLNLVGNAIKFTVRGQVLLTIRYVPPVAGRAEARLHVIVGDTGPGIAMAEQARLFGPFQQGQAGRQAPGGTGLGLAISRHFVELMGGTIELDSAPGRGSRFALSVRVEAAASADSEDVARVAVGRASAGRRPRALVVDDTDVNRRLMARLMGRLDITTVCVDDGPSAIAAFAACPCDLVWMDLVMPGMRGDRAMRALRELPGGRAVRIVCVTADAFAGVQLQAGDGEDPTGFDRVVLRPVAESQLVEVVHQLLGVEFAYRDAAARPSLREQETVAALYALAPPDWTTAFRQAVVLGDLRLMSRHLASLPAAHDALRARLRLLLDRIDLRGLALLVGEVGPGSGGRPGEHEDPHGP